MASAQGRATEALVQEAVEQLLGYEEWFCREVDKGLVAADKGEFVEHDAVRQMIVRWIRPAADDLNHICDYTQKRFGAAQARRAAMAICDAADALKDMPLCGRAGKEAVAVVRILHGSQRWP